MENDGSRCESPAEEITQSIICANNGTMGPGVDAFVLRCFLLIELLMSPSELNPGSAGPPGVSRRNPCCEECNPGTVGRGECARLVFPGGPK